MSLTNAQYNSIMKDYEQTRDRNRHLTEQRRREVYTKLPEYGRLDESVGELSVEVRHIAQGRNVPMYKTNIQTVKAGPFEGPMVCSMRPMTPENAQKAYDITVKMPNVHGAPVHMGDPAQVGVADVMKPDYGEAVDIYEGEIPVFWPCGVTPQAAIENAKPPIVITHAPGHMFITDVLNTELNEFLERKKAALTNEP